MLRNLVMAVAEKPGAWLLHGPPRTGKTEIALEAGCRLESQHEVIFLNCRNRTADHVLSKLSLRDSNCVVILDDVCTDEIGNLVPRLGVRVICTSRKKDFRFATAATCLEVAGFSQDEADEILARNVGGDDVVTYQKAWRVLARRMGGSPAALIEAADKILSLNREYSRGAVLQKLRTFDAPGEHKYWREAAAEVPEQAQWLLRAYAVCAPQGTWLHLAGAIAGVHEADIISSNKTPLDSGLLRCINAEREYYQLHPLLPASLRNSEWWEEWRERHYHKLMEWLKSRASDTANWRRCLGESTVAARWLAEKEDFGRIVHLLDTPKQEIQDDRRPLRDPVGDSGLVRRHYYLQGRLCQLFGEPMEAEKRLNAYLKQSQDSGKWEDAAEAMSLLALTHLLHPLPQLGEHNESGASGVPDVLGRVLRWLRNDGSGQAVGEPAGSQRERFFNDALREALRKLAEQTALYRKHRDWTGVASSLGSQAVLFLELGNIQDAERLLMVRARLLVKRKIWQPLPRIDEGLGVSRDSGKRSYS